MVKTNLLSSRMLSTRAPDYGTRMNSMNAWSGHQKQSYSLFHLLGDLLVNSVTEIADSALSMPQHDWSAIVGSQTPGFSVNSYKVQCFPHWINQFVDIEPLFWWYRYGVWDLVSGQGIRNCMPSKAGHSQQVNFLYWDGIDLYNVILLGENARREILDELYWEPEKNFSNISYKSNKFLTYRAGMYTRFPSITSTRSSAVALGSRIATSALLILYSLRTALISSWSMFVRGTVFVIAIPPFSFLRTRTAGGRLLRRIPNPSNSVSMSLLSPKGLRTSRTMNMRLHVRATAVEFWVEMSCRVLTRDRTSNDCKTC